MGMVAMASGTVFEGVAGLTFDVSHPHEFIITLLSINHWAFFFSMVEIQSNTLQKFSHLIHGIDIVINGKMKYNGKAG